MCSFIHNSAFAAKVIYQFNIHEEIAPPVTRLTERAIAEAERIHADFILIDMDTYGGAVDDADKIRTALLRTKIPTLVFIRNNAASAGALISIACDSIYMASGATIGAASVVNGQGELMPEKYQSYMRKKMRATAEETHRNPLIAEGMADENLEIEGIKTKGKIITFSVDEAVKYGYCNGKVQSMEELKSKLNGGPYIVQQHQSNWLERLILLLVRPAVSGFLLLLIFGGIYFEYKAPGTLLPIAVSLIAAAFYFAPLYLEGLAANWEIVLFVAGIMLLLVEIYILPGFALPGITGILFMVAALTLALIRNIVFDFTWVPTGSFSSAFLMVSLAMVAPLIFLILFGKYIFQSSTFKKMSIEAEMSSKHGFTVRDAKLNHLLHKTGTAITDLRPAGKIEINGERHEANANGTYVLKGNTVKVTAIRGTYLIVERVDQTIAD